MRHDEIAVREKQRLRNVLLHAHVRRLGAERLRLDLTSYGRHDAHRQLAQADKDTLEQIA